MKVTKKLITLFIVIAILINCFAYLNSVVYAENEGPGGTQTRVIQFDTGTHTSKTATFTVDNENITVTISGTTSNITADGENGRLEFTEFLGDTLKLQVSNNFNSEIMEVVAASGDGFNHELPVDENRFVVFSGTETEQGTGNPHSWGVPSDFHFGIVKRGSNSGPQPVNNRTVIQFDSNTFTTNTVTFSEGIEKPVTVTVSGTQANIEPNGNGARIEFEEELGNPVRFQVDENFNPQTMEIYAADGGSNGFTKVLSVAEDRYIVFPSEVIGIGGFHFGIAAAGGSPMNIDQMKSIMLDNLNQNDEDDITIYANKQVTNSQGISFDIDTNTLTIENLNAPDRALRLNCIGEGFNLNVIGNNKIKMIQAFTQFDHCAQEIYIKGNGTLTLNENGKEENAIYMCTYFGRSTLKIGENVTLSLKAKNNVINLEMLPEEDMVGQQAVIFEGKQNIQVSKEQCYFHMIKRLDGYSYYKASDGPATVGKKIIRNSDPDGIYIGSEIYDVDNNYQPIPETKRYQISKYIHCKTSMYDCYFVDPNFESEHHNEIVLSPAEFAASEYSFVTNTNGQGEEEPIYLDNSAWLNMISEPEIFKDANNKEYVVMGHYNPNTNQEECDGIYDFSAIQGTPYYWLEENKNVDFNSLEPIYVDNIQDGVFNYVVHGTTLNIEPIKAHVHTPKAAVIENEIRATCSKEGSYDEVIYCSECNEEISRTKKTTEKLVHTPKEITSSNIIKATLWADGKIVNSKVSKCEVCGQELESKEDSKTIPYPKKISLSKTSFTYNNKAQKPTVKVVGSDGKEISSSNYTVSYSKKSSKDIGEYDVKIKFKGNYEGEQTLTYKIKPKGTSLGKLTAGNKQFKATWTAQKTQTSGYEIQYSTDKNFASGNKSVKVTKNKTTSNTFKKLKAKKKYYVRIRTYKIVKGKKIYSDWSKSKNITTKK